MEKILQFLKKLWTTFLHFFFGFKFEIEVNPDDLFEETIPASDIVN